MTSLTEVIELMLICSALVEASHDVHALLTEDGRYRTIRNLSLELGRSVVHRPAEEPGELQDSEVVVARDVRTIRVAARLDGDQERNRPHDKGCKERDPWLSHCM